MAGSAGVSAGSGVELETLAIVADADLDRAAHRELAEQQFLGERPLDLFLDEPRHGARTHLRVVALLGQPATRIIVEQDRHALLLELRLDLDDELVDHALDDRHVERRELDDGVDAVAELG